MPTYRITFDYDTSVIDAGRAARGLPPFEDTILDIAVKLAQQAALDYPDESTQAALAQVEAARQAILNAIASRVSIVREPEQGPEA